MKKLSLGPFSNLVGFINTDFKDKSEDVLEILVLTMVYENLDRPLFVSNCVHLGNKENDFSPRRKTRPKLQSILKMSAHQEEYEAASDSTWNLNRQSAST